MQRWMLLACAALTWVMGSELLIDIWQAHALLLPFLAYLVLMVGHRGRQARWVPWAAAVASLLVQTHISYVYVLGGRDGRRPRCRGVPPLARAMARVARRRCVRG